MATSKNRPPRLPNGTPVHVKSGHFAEECDGVVTKGELDGGWLYRVKPTAGDAAVKAAAEGRKAKKAKAAKPKGERKPGLLTLAADVLKDAKAPMDCKAIVEKVLAKGTWQTKGKTPAATLYAAVIREIAAKGKDARFKKTDRGQFELSAAGK